MPDLGEDVEFDPKAGTFKELVMLHFHNCIKFMSVEFRGGYYTMVPTKDGQDKEIYIPDTREIFCNAILSLSLVLLPKYDKEMKEKFTKYDIDNGENKKEFIDISEPEETIILGDSFYTAKKDKLALETYKQQKLQIHIELFRSCSELLGRKNYLSIGGEIF